MLYIAGPLAFLAAALVVYALVLPACAALPLFGRLFAGFCAAPTALAETPLGRERERRAALEAELHALERELRSLASCPVPAPPPQPEPQQQAEADPAAIDPERWRQQDVGLLEGCWLLDSDYRLEVLETGRVFTVPYWRACFDGAGAGRQEFRLSDQSRCASGMSAQFEGTDRLILDDRVQVPCTNGIRILRRRAICQLDAQNQAICEIRDERGATTVRLRRDE